MSEFLKHVSEIGDDAVESKFNAPEHLGVDDRDKFNAVIDDFAKQLTEWIDDNGDVEDEEVGIITEKYNKAIWELIAKYGEDIGKDFDKFNKEFQDKFTSKIDQKLDDESFKTSNEELHAIAKAKGDAKKQEQAERQAKLDWMQNTPEWRAHKAEIEARAAESRNLRKKWFGA